MRPIATAVLLAVGSELTTGETRDSNGGELAASLAAAGVTVRRITALPDDLDGGDAPRSPTRSTRSTSSSRRVASGRRPTT